MVADVHAVRDIDPDDPVNMSSLLALDWTQAAPQRFRLNDDACKNIESMLTTLDTSHFEMSPLNDAVQRNIAVIEVTLETSHFEMSPLKDCAARNIEDMSITLDTSQFEMPPLNIVL